MMALISALMTMGIALHGQRVLHFTATSGWDHNTREVSFAMFGSIASDLGVIVDDDATGETFSDVQALAMYSVIVFSNTSGDAILDPDQRTNFEDWMANGGRVMGIHAASDTYRHSTANGNNTGTWDFYAELIGASVQENPNHVSGTPQYAMEHIGTHASTANLPDPWVKNEEYYYWENGYYGTDNTEVLRVEETVGPNGQVNSYDLPRAMSWYRMLPNGSRVFYTALGHATDNYTNDILFRTHIMDALEWLLDGSTGMHVPEDRAAALIHPNPVIASPLIIQWNGDLPKTYALSDAQGRIVIHGTMTSTRTEVSLDQLLAGAYALRIGNGRPCVVIVTR